MTSYGPVLLPAYIKDEVAELAGLVWFPQLAVPQNSGIFWGLGSTQGGWSIWDADVEVSQFICNVNLILMRWGKMCLLTVSTGSWMRTERRAGPWDSLAAGLHVLVGLPCQLVDASNKTWAPGGDWCPLPPVKQGCWLPQAHLCPGTLPLHYTCRGS